jgi:hypothetical protein
VRDAVINSGMEHGTTESYDKLAELLASTGVAVTGKRRPTFFRGRTCSISLGLSLLLDGVVALAEVGHGIRVSSGMRLFFIDTRTDAEA